HFFFLDAQGGQIFHVRGHAPGPFCPGPQRNARGHRSSITLGSLRILCLCFAFPFRFHENLWQNFRQGATIRRI
ncbi:uncharacterized protein METZ01_LOCUS442865, partial [marine metagenome]